LLAGGAAFLAGAAAGFVAVLVAASAAFAGVIQSAADTTRSEAMAGRHAPGRGFVMIFPLIVRTGVRLGKRYHRMARRA
jgi:hypothetical protein